VFRKGFLNNWSPAGMNAFHATIKHGGAIDALRVAEKLRTQPHVEGAEATIASEVILASTTPNDAVYNASADNRWHQERVQLPATWDKTTGSSDVVIAILDDGIELNHPDLKANIYKNAMDVPGANGADDEDGDGYADDVNGWDFFVDHSIDPNTKKERKPLEDNDPSPTGTDECLRARQRVRP